ncbi:hypothetical protein Nepgr_018298 [Nepenthes gracilis]|uniref:CUE domain-containing protein n=1 Tax=Nepenthes gracilis TaxID=150966 RepID=A0AAD3STU1_NEPGR|nr:hypothetical protein Nepgr_018298 [Nepenthes gracilis]
MTNRSAHYQQKTTRGFPKDQKQFVPETSNSAPEESKTNSPFSTSLRDPLSRQSDAAATPNKAASVAAASGSRVRLVGNSEWVPNRSEGGGNFVSYLPQDEAVATGLGAEEGALDPVESQGVVDLLNRELSRLLKLKPRDFWREVATDGSLHDFLDSFLQFRNRWYDFPFHGAKGIVAGVIVGDFELSCRVFMVLYRISSNKDPGASAADSLSLKEHGILLQEKRLLDVPKLLDICAIYGHENRDLTRSLVLNALKAQPGIHNNLMAAASHFLRVVYTMYQRCSSSLEVIISAGWHEDPGANRRHVEYLEVMDFLNDAITSVDSFVTAYNPAAVFFGCPVELSHGSEELINILARLHDSLLPSLQEGFQIISAAGGDDLQKKYPSILSDVSVSLNLLSIRIVDFGWKLLEYCYLSKFEDDLPLPAATKMFPANVEDPAIRGDILVQTFKEIAEVPQHTTTHGIHSKGTYLQNIEKKYRLMGRVESLQSTGWIFVDHEQYQYLAGMMKNPMISSCNELTSSSTSVKADGPQIDVDAVIMESKISQIKDIFPDYGKGFLSACLEVYNHDPEEVIQRILEGTLHEDLQTMVTSLEILPPKSSSPNKNDKGKAKLLESPLPAANVTSDNGKQRPQAISSSSSSSVGRFTRKSRVDEPDHRTLDTRDEKHMEKTAALLSHYEYEDEYDDSFDDLGITVVESGFDETQLLGTSAGTEGERSASNAADPRWNSRKKPQFYVKDGKNYSYKVEGAVAVANQNEASMVTQAQRELIYGLGRGGNIPLGAVKKLEELNREEGNDESDSPEGDGRGNAGNSRGRGRGRRGGGRNHYRKDRAMKKHLTGLGGY